LCSQYMMWINVFSIFSAILPWHSKSTRKEGACKINLNVLSWIRRDFSRWFFFFLINKRGFYFYLWICCNIVYYLIELGFRVEENVYFIIILFCPLSLFF
jgi:hypothetical protein